MTHRKRSREAGQANRRAMQPWSEEHSNV